MGNPLVDGIWGVPTLGRASPNSNGLGSPLMGGPTPQFTSAAGEAAAAQWFWKKTQRTLSIPDSGSASVPLAPRGSRVVMVDLFPLLGNSDPINILDAGAAAPGVTSGRTCYQLDPGRCLHLWVDDFIGEMFDLGDFHAVSGTGTLSNSLLITVWSPTLLKAR